MKEKTPPITRGASRDLLGQVQQFSDLDRHFSDFLLGLAAKPGPELALAAALASLRTREGHTCLKLPEFAGRPGPGKDAGPSLPRNYPELRHWTAKLQESGVVGEPGAYKPLILDPRGRLYLHRYWEYEKTVIDFIKGRAASNGTSLNLTLLTKTLGRLFPAAGPADQIDWQKTAAIVAALNRFSLIAGGPGTGKTSTVARILTLLLEQAARPEKIRIRLAAPTGKAAARLQESINQARLELRADPAILALIPDRATTLHRLLGTLPGSPYFRHTRENQLKADIVVIDEASMVDLPLMAKLMEALPENTRLILLGDREQLSSVEPGAVLGDICHPARLRSFSERFLQCFDEICGQGRALKNLADSSPATTPPLADTLVELDKNYRFRSDSSILALSKAIREADSTAALAILTAADQPGLTWAEVSTPAALHEKLTELIEKQPQDFKAPNSPAEGLAALNRFRILGGLRRGPYGVETLNKMIEKILFNRGLLAGPVKDGPAPNHYHGRPIMINRNAYDLDLYNGDMGVVLRVPEGGGDLRAFFAREDNGCRSLPVGHLPSHETLYAMTVHKSQGSEFEEVLLILPAADSPALTRELIYTAITRAKKNLTIWGDREIIEKALGRNVKRDSGLSAALWGESQSQP